MVSSDKIEQLAIEIEEYASVIPNGSAILAVEQRICEYLRKEFDKKEIHYLETILKDGIEQGIFDVINNIKQTAEVVHYALKGLEVPAIRGVIALDYSKKEDRAVISNLIFKGLYKR